MTLQWIKSFWMRSFECAGVRRSSSELDFFNKNQGNSRFDMFFQVFLGDCIDFKKNTEIQGLTDIFKLSLVTLMISKKSGWIQWMTDIFKFSLVTLMISKKQDEFNEWHIFSIFHWWLYWFQKNQGEFNEWQIFSNSHWRLYWNLRRHGHFKDWSISSSLHLSLECFSSKKHTLNHIIFQFHRCFWAYHDIYCKSNSMISGCCDLLEWFFYQALASFFV